MNKNIIIGVLVLGLVYVIFTKDSAFDQLIFENSIKCNDKYRQELQEQYGYKGNHRFTSDFSHEGLKIFYSSKLNTCIAAYKHYTYYDEDGLMINSAKILDIVTGDWLFYERTQSDKDNYDWEKLENNYEKELKKYK